MAHLSEQHCKHTLLRSKIPLSHFLLRTADPHQHTKLLPAECHFMTGGMVAPTAPRSTRTHKKPAYTHTHTHGQSCTRKHAATQPLSNKSAALLHPVRLNRGSAADLLSCVVPLANFSTVQCPKSCLFAGSRDEELSGQAYFWAPSSCIPLFSPLLPPALLQPPLSSSFLSPR